MSVPRAGMPKGDERLPKGGRGVVIRRVAHLLHCDKTTSSTHIPMRRGSVSKSATMPPNVLRRKYTPACSLAAQRKEKSKAELQ